MLVGTTVPRGTPVVATLVAADRPAIPVPSAVAVAAIKAVDAAAIRAMVATRTAKAVAGMETRRGTPKRAARAVRRSVKTASTWPKSDARR